MAGNAMGAAGLGRGRVEQGQAPGLWSKGKGAASKPAVYNTSPLAGSSIGAGGKRSTYPTSPGPATPLKSPNPVAAASSASFAARKPPSTPPPGRLVFQNLWVDIRCSGWCDATQRFVLEENWRYVTRDGAGAVLGNFKCGAPLDPSGQPLDGTEHDQPVVSFCFEDLLHAYGIQPNDLNRDLGLYRYSLDFFTAWAKRMATGVLFAPAGLPPAVPGVFALPAVFGKRMFYGGCCPGVRPALAAWQSADGSVKPIHPTGAVTWLPVLWS